MKFIKIKSLNTLFFAIGVIFTWFCISNMSVRGSRNPLMVTRTFGEFQLQPFFFDNKLVVKRNDVIDIEILFDDYSEIEKYIFYNSSGQSIVVVEKTSPNNWIAVVKDSHGNKLKDIDFNGIFDIKQNGKNEYIFINSKWLQVERIEKLHTFVKKEQYEFTEKVGWKKMIK